MKINLKLLESMISILNWKFPFVNFISQKLLVFRGFFFKFEIYKKDYFISFTRKMLTFVKKISAYFLIIIKF